MLIIFTPQISQSWSQWSAASRWTDFFLMLSLIRGHSFSGAPTFGPGFMEWLQTWSASMVALSLVAAFGLYRRTKWGRTGAIVAALFALFHPVLGTILGIYTLSVLSPAEAGIEYQRSARTRS